MGDTKALGIQPVAKNTVGSDCLGLILSPVKSEQES